MFRPPSLPSTVAFLLLCATILVTYLRALARSADADEKPALPRVLTGAVLAVVWLAALALIVKSGWAAAQPMPRMLWLMGGVLGGSLLIGLSPIGTWLTRGTTLSGLVAFQIFRFPLELILHGWVDQGSIPATMTWTGANWDVFTGLAAILLSPLAKASPLAAWLANAIGIVLLANVCRVVAMSSSLPFAWPVKPPLEIAFHLPYAAILPVCVGGALIGHVVLTRALLKPEVDSASA